MTVCKLSNKLINYSYLAIIKIVCYHSPYSFYYLQNNMMITTQLGLLSLFLTICFTVLGDFVLHRVHRRGDSVREDFVRLPLRSIFDSLPPSPTSRTDKDFGLHPPIICLFRLSDFLLLDVAPSLLLVLAYGTIYLRTLPPHCRCLHLSVI